MKLDPVEPVLVGKLIVTLLGIELAKSEIRVLRLGAVAAPLDDADEFPVVAAGKKRKGLKLPSTGATAPVDEST